MTRSIGFLASELQGKYPRGVTRVARAYAERLAQTDEFDLVCLLRRVPQQSAITYRGCDLKDWLRAHPLRCDPDDVPLPRKLFKGVLRWTLPPALAEALYPTYAFLRNGLAALRTRNRRALAPADYVTLKELDALVVFDPCSQIYDLPLENEPAYVAGWFHDAIPLRIHEGHQANPDQFSAAVSRLTSQAGLIVCDSASAEADLHTFFPRSAGKTVVIHHGHDQARFRAGAPAEKRREVLAKYLSDVVTPYFIAVGDIEPRKNTVALLRACRYLRETSDRRFQLVLVGRPGGFGRRGADVIEGLCRSAGAVRTDYVEDADLPALTSGALALLYPSLWEGFGIPPLEALSAGTLVVASDLASLPEVLESAAIYCDPYDVRSIAAAMQECLEMSPEERQRRIALGIQHAQRFTWEASVAKLTAHLRAHFRDPARPPAIFPNRPHCPLMAGPLGSEVPEAS